MNKKIGTRVILFIFLVILSIFISNSNLSSLESIKVTGTMSKETQSNPFLFINGNSELHQLALSNG